MRRINGFLIWRKFTMSKDISVSIKTLLNELPRDSYRFRGDRNQQINLITWDYKKVGKNSLYFCVEDEEFQEDHIALNSFSYWDVAIQAGASCLVVSKDKLIQVPPNVSLLEVADVNQSMALISRTFYGDPLLKMQVVGITGTNGKTTTSQLLDSIFSTANSSVGVIGTIATVFPSGKQDASHLSNPMSTELFAIGKKMQNEKVDTIIMEVTSHAMAFQRNHAIDFDVAIFTNFTQDHLDFHITMGAYKNEKLKHFRQLGHNRKKSYGVINIDDAVGNEFRDAIDKEFIAAGKVNVLTYGILNKDADFVAAPKEITGSYSVFDIIYRGKHLCEINLPMPGLFNIYNSLAAFGASFALGIGIDQITEGLKRARQIDGRFEKVPCVEDVDVYVDYAHTPDALSKILEEIKAICRRRLIVVFGCGGDRDRSKRPLMGKIASQIADFIIITADNPRDEDQSNISHDIILGIPEEAHSKFIIEKDRKEAILLALEIASPGDSVLIAGKGHEKYQIVGGKSHSFSDRKTICNHRSYNPLSKCLNSSSKCNSSELA
jgi:UDP-N-acetylmuramoyl-L-alanyl-D-glutamate--2,6-diaminopimelate ligase